MPWPCSIMISRLPVRRSDGDADSNYPVQQTSTLFIVPAQEQGWNKVTDLQRTYANNRLHYRKQLTMAMDFNLMHFESPSHGC
jgi:hypothetical protein